MSEIGKGIASLSVCVLSGLCFSLGHTGWGGWILVIGLLFIWQ
jgi:hypothetical protein